MTERPVTPEEQKYMNNIPKDELAMFMREASVAVENELAIEDQGWISLSGTTGDIIQSAQRIQNVKLSRLYATKEPMGKQSIRIWTDYTFGEGMTYSTPEDAEATKEVLEAFWSAPENRAVLSARGQRKSSDKLLIDGEVFFALFFGSSKEPPKIRWIDPLEITEIITDPDDREDIKYFKREWADTHSKMHTGYYRAATNVKGEEATDQYGLPVKYGSMTDMDQDAIIYFLNYNTITQRGNPLLLPALLWMKYYTKFLASRIAVMLAIAKWAWHTKVKGGQAAVDAIRAKTHDTADEIPAGSNLLENLGSDTQPIKSETGAKNAYTDGRMVKLQICAAVGIPEQYFGDISIGNLATAKTVELPMLKMFTSYQQVWRDTYKDINDMVLAHSGIAEDKRYVDLDFPPIAPDDAAAVALAIKDITSVMPQLADQDEVIQVALMALGVNDPQQVIDALNEEPEVPEGEPAEEEPAESNILMLKVLRALKESLKKEEKEQ